VYYEKENSSFPAAYSIKASRRDCVCYPEGRIMDGSIAPGFKLPPEREMAETFNVNRAHSARSIA